MNLIKTLCVFAYVVITLSASVVSASDIRAIVSGKLPDDVKGTFIYFDTDARKAIELNEAGEVVWSYKIPSKYRQDILRLSVDLEWDEKTESLMLAIPKSGYLRVNKSGEVIAECDSKFISHDADLLESGNVIFVNAWDADSDPIVTELDSNCKKVREVFFDDLGVPKSERKAKKDNGKYSNTHINAIEVLKDGNLLLSLRNFNQVVIWDGSSITESFKNITKVHDPIFMEGELYAAYHKRCDQRVVKKLNNKVLEDVWVMPKGDCDVWSPIRTMQSISDKYFFITGSQAMGLIDLKGNLLWEAKLKGFGHQKKQKGRDKKPFLYKAVFVSAK